MNKTQLKIKTYFPKVSSKVKDKQEFADLIIDMMRKDGNIKCAGYYKEEDFQKDLFEHLGDENLSQYKPLLSTQIEKVEKNIQNIIEKCHEVLPHPDLPIFIFVYPWFSSKESKVMFQGTTGLAAYYTIHLFVDPSAYNEVSIEKTIAHEWSHLVYYRYHDEHQCSLLDHIIMEGLAEIFREEIIGGGVAPWSLALNEAESIKGMKLLDGLLDSTSMKLYREVFWGDDKFKRWTGYSIGYNIVKKYRDNSPQLSWEEIIKKKSGDILDGI